MTEPSEPTSFTPSVYIPGPYDAPPQPQADPRTQAWTGQIPAQPTAPPPYAAPATRRSRTGLVVALVIGCVVLLAGGGLAVAAATGQLPFGTDSGVTACRRLAAVKDKTITVPALPAGRNTGQQARIEFAGSRHSDLRQAGTQAIDLISQYGGKSGDALALASAGQLVEKWAALSGACSAHGVTIPTLSEMAEGN